MKLDDFNKGMLRGRIPATGRMPRAKTPAELARIKKSLDREQRQGGNVGQLRKPQSTSDVKRNIERHISSANAFDSEMAEGGMGGINRAAPAQDVSYEHMLDEIMQQHLNEFAVTPRDDGEDDDGDGNHEVSYPVLTRMLIRQCRGMWEDRDSDDPVYGLKNDPETLRSVAVQVKNIPNIEKLARIFELKGVGAGLEFYSTLPVEVKDALEWLYDGHLEEWDEDKRRFGISENTKLTELSPATTQSYAKKANQSRTDATTRHMSGKTLSPKELDKMDRRAERTMKVQGKQDTAYESILSTKLNYYLIND